MPSKKNYSGLRFGKLTAIECTGTKDNSGKYLWKFLCDCGNFYICPVPSKNGGRISCGCAAKDAPKKRKNYHGMKGTPEYECWQGAKYRCHSKSNASYSEYGAIGITMSDEFRYSFVAFLEYMGRQPDDGRIYTLDRLDNSRGYERGNMRWATYTQQARNRSMYSTNTTGKAGIHFDVKCNTRGNKTCITYAVATWIELETNKQRRKLFSVKKYGLLEAFATACAYRDAKIKELNEQGAGYTESHGK